MVASLLAAASFLLTRGGGDDGNGPIDGLDTRLDYALENFEMRAFDENGAQAMRLWAPRLTNDAMTDIGEIAAPLIVEHRIAHSRSPVRLEDPSGTLRATGFRIDMGGNEFQLQDDVRARYAIPQ